MGQIERGARVTTWRARLAARKPLVTAALTGVWCLASAACEEPRIVRQGTSLMVSPAVPSVGQEVTVRIEDMGALESTVLENLRVTPEGILERTAMGRYVAVGAGKVSLFLPVSGAAADPQRSPVATELLISCPMEVGEAQAIHVNERIEQDATFQGQHRIEGTLSVTQGRLTLDSCSELVMAEGAEIQVEVPGEIVVRGSRENPVLVRGATTDAGRARWRGIRIHLKEGSAPVLRWLTLEDADGIDSGRAADPSRAALFLVGERDLCFEDAPFVLDGVRVQGCGSVGIGLRELFAQGNYRGHDVVVEGCAGFPLSTDAQSMGALPVGSFTGNGADEVEVIGGWAGPGDTHWRAHGIPYRVRDSIYIEAERDRVPPTSYDGTPSVVIDAGVTLAFERGGLFVGRSPTRMEPSSCAAFTQCQHGDGCCPLGCSFLELDKVPEDHRDSDCVPQSRLIALGTRELPIRFTSAALAPKPGDWIGIVFTQSALLRFYSITSQQYGEQYETTLMASIVEYAGAPNELRGPNGEELRGGVIVLQQLGKSQTMAPYLLEATTIRYNAGFGIARLSPQPKLTVKSLTGNTADTVGSCVCENELGPVTPEDEATPCAQPADCPAGQNCVGPSEARSVCVEASITCPCGGKRGPWVFID